MELTILSWKRYFTFHHFIQNQMHACFIILEHFLGTLGVVLEQSLLFENITEQRDLSSFELIIIVPFHLFSLLSDILCPDNGQVSYSPHTHVVITKTIS